jgi:hypothetical protein
MDGQHADVAQLVEHHLAKVGVAGSNPVVRSRSEAISAVHRASASDTLGDSRRGGPVGEEKDPGKPEHEKVTKVSHGERFSKDAKKSAARKSAGGHGKGKGSSGKKGSR